MKHNELLKNDKLNDEIRLKFISCLMLNWDNLLLVDCPFFVKAGTCHVISLWPWNTHLREFDSFCKKVSCNFLRNLERAESNRTKHYSDEPVEYLLEFLGSADEYPSDSYGVADMKKSEIWKWK